MILNIQMPSRPAVQKQPASMSSGKDKKYSRMSRPDKRDRNNVRSGPNRRGDGQRDFSRGDDRLSHNSKKIKKDFKHKKNQRAHKQFDDDVDLEDVLVVDEKKDEESHVFVGDNFDEIPGLNANLVRGLKEHNFVTLTQIQKEAIPIVIKNKDCIIKSETGSGKTLAYLVPIIHQLGEREEKIKREDGTFCVIICPTRELCIQVVETCKQALKNLVHIVVGAIMGGEQIKKEKARLRKGINILVSTPGRLLYHIQNTTCFNYVPLKYIVFEESDRTLDLGFKKELDELVVQVSQKTDYQKIQKILISANFSEQIQALTAKISAEGFEHIGFKSNNPEEIAKEEAQNAQDDAYKLPAKLSQKYVVVGEGHRISFILSILMASQNSKIMIFVATCDEVEFLETLFQNVTLYPAEEAGDEEEPQKIVSASIFKLHGKIDQKSRTKAYLEFKKSNNSILICTDVASRGLDFEDVRLIIQLDPPATITDYVNRMGRTARIGNYGMSLMFLTKSELAFVDRLSEKGINVERYEQEEYNDYIEDRIRKDLNEEMGAHPFLVSRIRDFMRRDMRHKVKGRKAYMSYVRAYAKMEDKEIFHPKNLNLQLLAKSYGLHTSHTVKDEMDSEGLISRQVLKDQGKRRRVVHSKILEKEEFM